MKLGSLKKVSPIEKYKVSNLILPKLTTNTSKGLSMSLLVTYITKLRCSVKVFLIKCEKLFKKIVSIKACILKLRAKKLRL